MGDIKDNGTFQPFCMDATINQLLVSLEFWPDSPVMTVGLYSSRSLYCIFWRFHGSLPASIEVEIVHQLAAKAKAVRGIGSTDLFKEDG